LSAATDGYLDWFVVIYWSVVILFTVLADAANNAVDQDEPETPMAKQRTPSLVVDGTNKAANQDEPETSLGQSAFSDSPLGRRRTATLWENSLGEHALAPNMWALCAITSHGKAKTRRGKPLSPLLIYLAACGMGLLQLLTLSLVVYDIDPSASPYTIKPAAPWKETAHTVNCMKFIMVFFLGMHVFSEAADAYDNLIIGMGLTDEELLVSRCVVLFIPLYHYLVTLAVILCGVSVVLSSQDVPNILYSSMAILFITQVDELFWQFFCRTFSVNADWNVKINDSRIARAQLLKRCIIMFPMMWGFAILGKAWYRDQMPALIVRARW
jgi:hypothetical protein